MFDPGQLTLGQISSTVRDLSIVLVLITVVWKARGLYEHGTRWFERWTRHMDVMESGLATLLDQQQTLLGNHLTHIEADLAKLSGRKPDENSAGE